MVSNSQWSIRSLTYVFSIVATPSSASRIRRPSTKLLSVGVCAITLLATITSARIPSSRSVRASSASKNSCRVGTPAASAAAACSGAGSMPSTGMPAVAKFRNR